MDKWMNMKAMKDTELNSYFLYSEKYDTTTIKICIIEIWQ